MENKPSIDERIEALTHNLELVALEQEEDRKKREEEKKRLDAIDERERKGRRAIMAALRAYFEAINGESE
jgi:hypothetical protein